MKKNNQDVSPKNSSQDSFDSFGELSSRSKYDKRKNQRMEMSLQFSKLNFKAKHQASSNQIFDPYVPNF